MNKKDLFERLGRVGLVIVETKTVGTTEVAHGVISINGEDVTIGLARSLKSQEGDFLPCFVEKGRKTYWSFKEEKRLLEMSKGAHLWVNAKLFIYNGHLVIYLEETRRMDGEDKKIVIKAFSLSDLVSDLRMGGQLLLDPAKTFELKSAIVRGEGIFYELSPEEKRFRDLSDLAKARKSTEKRQTAEERRNAILSRPRIIAYSQGVKISGLPVTEAELQYLPDNIKVILVESYDSEKKKAGTPLEAFFWRIEKGQGVRRGLKTELDQKHDVPPTFTDVEVLGHLMFILPAGPASVFHVSSDGFQSLKQAGINGGKCFAVGKPDNGGRYSVFQFQEKGKEPVNIGTFKPEE